MVIRTTCTKCGVTIRLDFGNLNKVEALEAAKKLDESPRECPGQHMELSGIGQMWGARDAVHRAYDLGEGEEPGPVISDEEYVEGLLAQGKDVVDGGCSTVPELKLPSIHDFDNLEHMGFGNFRSPTHLFLRCDSPTQTRYYERIERSA